MIQNHFTILKEISCPPEINLTPGITECQVIRAKVNSNRVQTIVDLHRKILSSDMKQQAKTGVSPMKTTTLANSHLKAHVKPVGKTTSRAMQEIDTTYPHARPVAPKDSTLKQDA
jgi:hypothetical protein